MKSTWVSTSQKMTLRETIDRASREKRGRRARELDREVLRAARCSGQGMEQVLEPVAAAAQAGVQLGPGIAAGLASAAPLWRLACRPPSPAQAAAPLPPLARFPAR